VGSSKRTCLNLLGGGERGARTVRKLPPGKTLVGAKGGKMTLRVTKATFTKKKR